MPRLQTISTTSAGIPRVIVVMAGVGGLDIGPVTAVSMDG